MQAVADPARELELADVAMAQGDADGLVAHLAAAIRGFTAAGDPRQAAMACARLGYIYENWIGNPTAARAWFGRADRLVAGEPPCVEQGWVAVAAMGCEVPDPANLLARAELALDRARQFGDVNLETKALADAGLAHVQAGRLQEGFALLDEAMALACASADDVAARSKSVCSFFTACYHAADFERAGTWATTLRGHGIIGPEPPGPAFLSSHCDSVQAAFLRELGRWREAEELLIRAIADFESIMGQPAWHPAIELADLRVRQGRLAEAEHLLLGKDATVQALLPMANLHLARGHHELAVAAARRGLRQVREDRVRAVELLAVVAEAALAQGLVDEARAATNDALARTRDLDAPTLVARAEVLHARVLAASGEDAAAVELLQTALDRLAEVPAPWLRACVRLRLAGQLEQQGNLPAAQVEAKAASSDLQDLDVVLTQDQHDLLQRLSPAAAHAATGRTATLAREGRWWLATCDGTSVRISDTKGLRYLAALLAAPGVERHALDLVDQIEGLSPAGKAPDRRRLGDAGALLDTRARTAYRQRIEALRSEADDALERGDDVTAMRLQDELDALVGELARAFGLGGRERRAASVAERARLNVTRATRSASMKLTDALPVAGGWLDRRVRTGLFCCYEPEPGDEVRWIVQ